MPRFNIRGRTIPTYLALFGVGFWAGTQLKYARVSREYAERMALQEATTPALPVGEQKTSVKAEPAGAIQVQSKAGRKSQGWIPITDLRNGRRPYASTSSETSESISTINGSSTKTQSSQRSVLDPSSPHHNLSTFLKHAKRTGLSPTSTVFTGTAYEYLTLETLRRYGFDLHRVGGRGDRGVDLIGFWRIPRHSQSGDRGSTADIGRALPKGQGWDTYRVLVQCKRLVGKHAKIGPNLVRELDGAVRGARLGGLFESIMERQSSTTTSTPESREGISPSELNSSTQSSPASSHGEDPIDAADNPDLSSTHSQSTTAAYPTIGILVGTRPATKGVVESLRRSNRALAWVMLEEAGPPSATPPDVAGTTTDQNEDVQTSSDSEKDISTIDHTQSQDINSDNTINIDTDLDHQTPSSRASPRRDSPSPQSPLASTSPSPEPVPPPQPQHPLSPSQHTSTDLRGHGQMQGHVKQILWNQAARDIGLEGVDVVKRYRSRSRSRSRTPSIGSDESVIASGGNGGSGGNDHDRGDAGATAGVEELVLVRAGRVILGV